MLRSVFIPVLLVAAAIVIAFLMVTGREDIQRRGIESQPPLVDVAEVKLAPVQTIISSRGMVRPLREINLVSEVSGRVVWVDPGFVQGEFVEEGELLLRIDPIDYEVALSDAKAAVASAEFALAEVEVVVMKAAIEEAKARLAASKDRLRQAEADLANTEIRAPFAAVVDSKQVDLGQYVQTGFAVTRLLSTELAEIRLPILGADVAFAKAGTAADGEPLEAVLSATLGATEFQWSAELARIEQRLDEQTRVYYLVAQVLEPYNTDIHEQPLPLGQFVQASLPGRIIDNAFSVSRRAIHRGGFVYLVRDGALHRQPVEIARAEGESVIVGSGLTDGDLVVLDQLDIMVEGMPVRVAP